MKKTFKQFLREESEASTPTASGRFITHHDIRSAYKKGKLADKLGVHIRDLSRMSDDELLAVIHSVGEHDLVPDSKFDPKELARGIEVEREHTQSNLVAKLIAKDHLSEIPDYYTRLDKMEAEGERASKDHK